MDGHDRHVNRHLWAQTINLSVQETEEDRAGGGTAGAAALALNIKFRLNSITDKSFRRRGSTII